MKIYTKKGDDGNTMLLGGARVSKSHLKIEGYGTIDELNSFIGNLRDNLTNTSQKEFLKDIQVELFTIGSYLASSKEATKNTLPRLNSDLIIDLESEMDKMDQELKPLTSFILPSGHPNSSLAHICRSVCRRAERQVVALTETENVEEGILKFLNRLSDYLFVLARKILNDHNIDEVKWEPKKG